jgi:FkbM family methyltransferase
MEELFAKLARNLFIIPGGYFIVQLLKKVFLKPTKSDSWRIFKFRGVCMKVDISKHMGRSIYWRGAHDWRPIFTMEKILQPGNVMIDVGANQGEYTLWAARKVFPNGKVLAFEPMESLFEQLQENINLNPRFAQIITPFKLGLSDHKGDINLYGKANDNEGVNTIYPTTEHQILIQKIALDSLDNHLAYQDISRIDLIKIDVEGAELQVLRGAKKALLEFKPSLIIEINEQACQAAGYQGMDILNYLKPIGYVFFEIGLRGRLKQIHQLNNSFCNILATVAS